jgi:hypothetical protein
MPKFNQVATLVRYAITANGNWRCPSDVTTILATGFGGGGGGAGSLSAGNVSAGGGGGGAIQSTISITVTPGTLYAIVIGAGGAAVAVGNQGNPGTDTKFNGGGAGPLSGQWSGASGGNFGPGGQCFLANGGTNLFTAITSVGFGSMASGGAGTVGAPLAGQRNSVGGFVGGAAGAIVTNTGGGGGGAGPEGAGGAGGTGSTTNGGTGTGAANNTGAGGGGGGSGTNASGGGGKGGSGKLYLEYWTVQTTVVTS